MIDVNTDPKVGEVWVNYANNEYVFIRRISPLYVYYDVITSGHLSGSGTIDGFKYNFQLYQ